MAEVPSTGGVRPVHLHAGPTAPVPDRDAVTDRLAALLDAPPAVLLTSSCTHALEAAMLLAGVGPGDEVVVPAFTLSSTANAALLRGATVRFADVRAHDANIDPVSVAERTSEATRAVVCVHYGGVAAAMDALTARCDEVGADLVEDAAHGLFGTWRDAPLGRTGRLGALSFHRTKNLSTIEGGALVVNDPALVDRARIAVDKGTDRYLVEAGRQQEYQWAGPGSAWRMADPMVTLLAAQLETATAVQRRRHEVWQAYRDALADWAGAHGVHLAPPSPEGDHPAHLFWLTVPTADRRDPFVAHCRAAGIEVARHYGSLPLSNFGRTVARPEDTCPVAADVAARLVRLPLHHELDDDDVERVVAAVVTAPV